MDRSVVAACAIVALGLLGYPLMLSSSFAQTIGILALIMAVAATGWNVLGGYCGQISFGHALFFATGMYGTALAVRAGWSPWLAMLPCSLAGAGLAVAIGLPCFRLRGHYFTIATITTAIIAVPIVTDISLLGAAQGLSLPLQPQGLWTLQFSLRDKRAYYYVALAMFTVATLAAALFVRSKAGYYVRAIRDDEHAAAAIGIPVRRYKLYAAALSGALTALAGTYQVMIVLFVDPSSLDLSLSTSIAVSSLVGGAGSAWGPLLGSWAVIALQEYTRTYLSTTGRSTDLLLYGALLVLIAMVEPQGLTGLVGRARPFIRRRLAHTPAKGPIT